jgi:hypothetical protein
VSCGHIELLEKFKNNPARNVAMSIGQVYSHGQVEIVLKVCRRGHAPELTVL